MYFVQLQDFTGQPAKALQKTIISLSSSLTNIGAVDSSIIILKGAAYASASFNTTFTPGATTISASATGFATVQTTMTTIGPIPSAIAVYGFPSILPADGNEYQALMIQLQDSSGNPTKSPQGGIQVTLSSSNTSIGIVTPVVTIPEGQTFVTANFTTTTAAQDEGRMKSVIITADSQGYTSRPINHNTTNTTSNKSHAIKNLCRSI